MTPSQPSQSEEVATITLSVRKDGFGRPVWIADGKHEAPTAAMALERAGATLDRALGSVPGFRWGDYRCHTKANVP